MNTKRYHNYKEFLYITGFCFVIFLRWSVESYSEKLMDMIGNEIFFLPAVLFIGLFYFHYDYFNNIFVIVRNGKEKVNKVHLVSVLKDCIYFPLYLLALAVPLSFYDFSVSNLTPTIITFSLFLSFYILLGFIYFAGHIFFKKFYICFLLNLIPIFIYRYYIIWWKQFLSSCFDMTRIFDNLLLLIINLFVIILIILIYKYKSSLKTIKLNSNLKPIVLYLCIEFICILGLRNYTVLPDSFSFNSLLFLDSSDRIISLLLWIMPKLYIVFYCFQYIYDKYKHNLVFHMVRISNREKWLRNQSLQIIKYLSCISILKFILSGLILKKISFALLLSTGYYFIYILFICMSIVMVYLVFKDISIVNFYLFCYFVLIFITAVYSINALDFFLLGYSVVGFIILILSIIISYFVAVWSLNNNEYYG